MAMERASLWGARGMGWDRLAASVISQSIWPSALPMVCVAIPARLAGMRDRAPLGLKKASNSEGEPLFHRVPLSPVVF